MIREECRTKMHKYVRNMNLYLSNLNEINQHKLFLINIILNRIDIDLKHMSGFYKVLKHNMEGQ
jgi:hypothetical protein